MIGLAGGKTMQLPEDIGKIVRFHRKQSGLSQAELAISVGVGKTTIYDIERGKNTVRMDKVFKVLTGLNITLTAESPLMRKMLGQDEEGE
jgi:HTH-type transcriptional regulator/antitoxin HipB